MREFNVTGLCVPEMHYMVDISEKIEQIFELVESLFLFIFQKKMYKIKKYLYFCKMKSEQVIDHIKDSILKFVPARCIYLFGSYAYGTPTEQSDFDIYLVTPDEINNFSELYTKIIFGQTLF